MVQAGEPHGLQPVEFLLATLNDSPHPPRQRKRPSPGVRAVRTSKLPSTSRRFHWPDPRLRMRLQFRPMPVPGYQEFMRPLLDVVSDGQDHNVREAYATVADRLGLTEADRQELIPSGTQRLLDNRAGWAKTRRTWRVPPKSASSSVWAVK